MNHDTQKNVTQAQIQLLEDTLDAVKDKHAGLPEPLHESWKAGIQAKLDDLRHEAQGLE